MNDLAIQPTIEQEFRNDPIRSLLLSSEQQITSAYRQAAEQGQEVPVVFVLDSRSMAAQKIARSLRQNMPAHAKNGDSKYMVKICSTSAKKAIQTVSDRKVRGLLQEPIFNDRYKIIAVTPTGTRSVSWPKFAADLRKTPPTDHEASNLILALSAFLYVVSILMIAFQPNTTKPELISAMLWAIHLVFWGGVCLHLFGKGLVLEVIHLSAGFLGTLLIIDILFRQQICDVAVLYYWLGSFTGLLLAGLVKLAEQRANAEKCPKPIDGGRWVRNMRDGLNNPSPIFGANFFAIGSSRTM